VTESGDAAAQHRPRPTPAVADPAAGTPRELRSPDVRPAARTAPVRSATRRTGRGRAGLAGLTALPRVDAQQSAQVIAAAGGAVVTAARVGRLLGRSGWRIARQLPVVDAVEQQAHKLRHAAAAELLKLLELPQSYGSAPSAEEHRAMLLVQDAGGDAEPLRTAMTELLERSTDPDRTRSREYLFGTLVSQLVPDEARILAQLAIGGTYAVVDVVAKQIGRSPSRTPANTPTYVTRLHSLGLVDIDPAGDAVDQLADQFDRLAADPDVRRARSEIDKSRGGSAKVVRRALRLSALGREFWTACAPSGTALARRSG
jgi:abortive infection alpha-like protein